MLDIIRSIANIGGPFTLLIATYLIGSYLERRHYLQIEAREADIRTMPTTSLRRIPAGWEVESVRLISGSVVISLDYFKRFLAGLRSIFGGRIGAYETLLDRARREAILRMQEAARGSNFDAVINVRLECSRLASARRDGKGTAGIEVLAYGTALKVAGRSQNHRG